VTSVRVVGGRWLWRLRLFDVTEDTASQLGSSGCTRCTMWHGVHIACSSPYGAIIVPTSC
jgi:hypothetical protein